MLKVVISLIVLLNILPVSANIVRYSSTNPSYNGFQSRLKMNQPTTITTYNNTPQRYRSYKDHCHNCHSRDYRRIYNGNLNALEKYAFNRTYGRENDLQRLERLENIAFGAIQSGDINSRYRNVESAILSRPQYSTKRTILGNLANYFAGQTTGFTPSLTNYPIYNNLGGFTTNPYSFMPAPGYSNNNYEQYSNGIFGGGWGISGHDYGTGSSVRILD